MILQNLKLLSLILLITTFASAQNQANPTSPEIISTMTVEKWQTDLDTVNKQIQSSFATFDFNAKQKFQTEIANLKKRLPELNNQQIVLELVKTVATLKDGHTLANVIYDGVEVFKKVPVYFYFFEGELFVLSGAPTYKDAIGAKVLKFGKLTTAETLEKIKPLLSAENDFEYHANAHIFLQMPEVLHYLGIIDSPESLEIEVQKEDNSTARITLPAVTNKEYFSGERWISARPNNVPTPLYDGNYKENYWYKFLEESKTLYFYYGWTNDQAGRPSLKDFFKEMFEFFDKAGAKKLVIDLRKNSGGNYQKTLPLIEEIKKRPELNQKGKIYVVTSRHTFSAPLVSATLLKKQTETILIGEPGRSNPNLADDTDSIILPNSKLRLGFTHKLKKHYPELTVNYLPVDFPVSLKFADYKKGIDPILEYIIKN